MKKLENIKQLRRPKNLDVSLKGSFYKESKEDSFKNLTKEIKLPEKELMKYTSKLKDSSIEYNNCSNCKNLMECKNQIEGFCYLPSVQSKKLIFSYKACKYMKKNLKTSAYKENVYVLDVPKEITNAKMKDIYTDDKNRFEVIKKLKSFIDIYLKKKEGKGIYLNGSFGSGKTYLIAAMFNELAKKGVKSAIIYWPELLRGLKESFKNYSYENNFNKIKKAPLLLIDDIGAENLTSWGRDEILGSLLQYRMQEDLPTFFTSNLSIKELEAHLSFSSGKVDKVKARRIIERIKQLAEPIELVSENRRK